VATILDACGGAGRGEAVEVLDLETLFVVASTSLDTGIGLKSIHFNR